MGAKNGGRRDWIITEKERAENGKTGESERREKQGMRDAYFVLSCLRATTGAINGKYTVTFESFYGF